jgi:cellobiose-specific phosphotransferase system component IIA
MSKTDNSAEITKMEELSSIDFAEDTSMPDMADLQDVIPHMNVGVPTTEITVEEERKSIISDGEILGIYGEIMDCIREDRKQVSDFIDTMAEMVINDGDATSSSKEALVNLVKIKSDMSDKMGKVADLMTRVKLKEKDTFPKYLAANQNNTINISEGASRRSLIEAINKAKKKKEENV